MTAYLFPIYTLLLFAAFQALRRHITEMSFSFNGTTILLAVTGALVVDNLIISAGLPLKEGALLAALNLGRWWLRVLLFPLLIVTYVEMTGRLEIKAAKTRTVALVVSALALLLVAVQAGVNFPTLQPGALAPEMLPSGTDWVVYAPPVDPVLPGTIAAHAVGAAFGLLMLVRARWPWVFLTASAVFAAATFVPVPLFAANGLETALLWALVATENRAQREGLQLSDRELETRLRGLE